MSLGFKRQFTVAFVYGPALFMFSPFVKSGSFSPTCESLKSTYLRVFVGVESRAVGQTTCVHFCTYKAWVFLILPRSQLSHL